MHALFVQFLAIFCNEHLAKRKKIPNLGSQFANYSMNAQQITKDI